MSNSHNHMSNSHKSNDNVIINHNIGHVRQIKSNDCGVACLKMALNFALKSENKSFNDNEFEQILKDLNVFDKSLWTIDIAHVLAIYKVKHEMFTITLGVLDSYSTETFYNSNHNFDSEKLRVNEKFNKTLDLGINVTKRSINLDEIKKALKTQLACVVILIDAAKLNGVNINYNEGASNGNNIDLNETISQNQNVLKHCCIYLINKLKPSFYCGHFIVLIGYDDTNNRFFYRNPSTYRNLSYTTQENLELARKAYGTDEDIIFVYTQ